MVYVLLADGFEEIEALGFIDILRRGEIDVKSVSVNKDNLVTGSHNISVNSDCVLSNVDFDCLDAVVLPGGMPGTTNLLNNDKVIDIIKYALKNDKYIGAICAAPMILGKLGILKDKVATCYPGFENELSGAILSDAPVCRDGKVITSRGAGTVHNFAHCFISTLKNEEIADRIISSMQY